MKKQFSALVLLWAFLGAAVAAPQTTQLGPEALVRKITSDVLDAVHGDKALQQGNRQAVLKLAEEKILPYVDFKEATRLAVGRNWRQASPEQRARLVAEFREMLVRTYSNAIGTYKGQTMKVLPVHMQPGDTDVTVRNQYIKPGTQPVEIDYEMHQTPQGWKIYDIQVEGVSLVAAYRSEFNEVVRQSGIEGLIKRLAEKNEAPKVAPS